MPLTKEKLKHFQEKLEEEKKQLESELSRVGRKIRKYREIGKSLKQI